MDGTMDGTLISLFPHVVPLPGQGEDRAPIDTWRHCAEQLKYRVCGVLQACLPSIVFNSLSVSLLMAQSICSPRKTPYWSHITRKLIVGGLPLKNWDHHTQLIKKEGVEAVVNLVEGHELLSRPFLHPVKPSDWRERNVSVLHLPCCDLGPVPMEILAEAVERVAERIQLDETVYLHCTAGRGRSVSVAVAYLSIYHGMSVDNALAYVRTRRPQAMLGDTQLEAIVEYCRAAEHVC